MRVNESIGKYRAFLAVADAGSVTEAARRLFISQPAVSAELAALEAALGTRLFVRSRRGVQLTEAGEILLAHVRSAFTMLDAGEARLRELAGLSCGTLRIGASDMTLRFYLLDHIAEFRRRYPGVRLSVTNAPTPKTLAALRDGSIDFGVVSGPIEEAGDLILWPVRTVQDILVAAPHHPLAGHPVTREELAAHPMMMLEGKTSTRAYVEGWLGEGFPLPTIELATSDLLVEFAKRGIGVASVVEDFAAPALASGELCRLEMDEPPPRTLYLARSRRLSPSAAAARMLSLLGLEGDTKDDT